MSQLIITKKKVDANKHNTALGWPVQIQKHNDGWVFGIIQNILHVSHFEQYALRQGDPLTMQWELLCVPGTLLNWNN